MISRWIILLLFVSIPFGQNVIGEGLYENELIEFKADKMPVGEHDLKEKYFKLHEIDLIKGDLIYVFSDGYADQFGGSRGKKFMHCKFKKLLLSMHEKEMAEQQQILDDTLKEWMKGYEQIDDICVMGVRV